MSETQPNSSASDPAAHAAGFIAFYRQASRWNASMSPVLSAPNSFVGNKNASSKSSARSGRRENGTRRKHCENMWINARSCGQAVDARQSCLQRHKRHEILCSRQRCRNDERVVGGKPEPVMRSKRSSGTRLRKGLRRPLRCAIGTGAAQPNSSA